MEVVMSFALRVRELLAARGISLSQLAVLSGLDPSLVSRLLTENADVRREARLEHVLAIGRAREMSPAELVAGTDALPLIGEMVPRDELRQESEARAAAQAEAATLRADLAGARREVAGLQTTIDKLQRKIAELDAASSRERTGRM